MLYIDSVLVLHVLYFGNKLRHIIIDMTQVCKQEDILLLNPENMLTKPLKLLTFPKIDDDSFF